MKINDEFGFFQHHFAQYFYNKNKIRTQQNTASHKRSSYNNEFYMINSLKQFQHTFATKTYMNT